MPLFISILVKNYIFDFKDIGASSIFSLWLLFIAKPFSHLGYEHYLAEVLMHQNLGFMERVNVSVGIAPDYNSNVDLFSCAMHFMRKKLREADSSQTSRLLRAEYDKNLQLVMQRMKDDLSHLKSNPAQHATHIEFVRQIISLIKSHGVNISVIDPFFTQPGPDYSPPLQDPQLHTAGIVAYGVRLAEKDARAVPQLFHYLYNHFKIALGNGKLEQEREILVKAMRSEPSVLVFVLEYMLPTIVVVCHTSCDAWLLLEVYADALGDLLSGKCIPRELSGGELTHAAVLLEVVLKALRARADPSGESLVIRAVLAEVTDALRPFVMAELYGEPGDVEEGLKRAAEATRRYLVEGAAEPGAAEVEVEVEVDNSQVKEFARMVVADVRRSWMVSEEFVTVQMAGGRPGTPSATQVGQGTRYKACSGETAGVYRDRFNAVAAKWGRGQDSWGKRKGRGSVVRSRDRRDGDGGLGLRDWTGQVDDMLF
jgi:hypothetical protein